MQSGIRASQKPFGVFDHLLGTCVTWRAGLSFTALVKTVTASHDLAQRLERVVCSVKRPAILDLLVDDFALECAEDKVLGVKVIAVAVETVDQWATEEKLEVEEVRELEIGDKRPSPTLPTRTRCTSDTMDEDTGTMREVVVDDVFEDWNINTTSGDVGDDQDVGDAASELVHLVRTGDLVEGPVDVGYSVADSLEEVGQVFDVMLGCGENQGLVGSGHLLPLLALELFPFVIFKGVWPERHLDDVAEEGEQAGFLFCFLH